MTVIIFLIVLAVLIFVHEFGHFIFARANGIRVDEFKIGFGPELFAWTRGETKYGLNLIPFGGYVKIFGENPDEESTNGADRDRSFVNKKRWQQALVLVAGVLFNFIFAWVLYVIVFTSGVAATREGFEQYADRFQNPRIMVAYVQPNSPAAAAGLEMGDVIQSVSGVDKTQLSITKVQEAINSTGGNTFDLTYTRGDETKTVQVMATSTLVQGKHAIGISMQDVGDLKLPFLTSVYEAGRYTLIVIRETAIGLYTFITSIFRGSANFADVAGPIGIAGIVGNAAERGITYLLMITAIISINLGVINLIPFPALDGGRTLMVLIEGVIRRRISPQIANSLNAVGFVLLMILMVVVTYKDVLKLF